MKKIILVSLLAFSLFILTGCTGESTTSDQSNSGSDSKVETQTKKQYSVKEPIHMEKHKVVVNKVTKNWKNSNEYIKPQSNSNMYVLIKVTITNTSDETVDFNPYGFKLEDSSGVRRDTTYADASNELESATLSPGGKVSGNMVFEAKKNSKKLLLHYSGSAWSGDEEITVKL